LVDITEYWHLDSTHVHRWLPLSTNKRNRIIVYWIITPAMTYSDVKGHFNVIYMTHKMQARRIMLKLNRWQRRLIRIHTRTRVQRRFWSVTVKVTYEISQIISKTTQLMLISNRRTLTGNRTSQIWFYCSSEPIESDKVVGLHYEVFSGIWIASWIILTNFEFTKTLSFSNK